MQRYQLLICADRFADPHTYSVDEQQCAQADNRLVPAPSAQADVVELTSAVMRDRLKTDRHLRKQLQTIRERLFRNYRHQAT